MFLKNEIALSHVFENHSRHSCQGPRSFSCCIVSYRDSSGAGFPGHGAPLAGTPLSVALQPCFHRSFSAFGPASRFQLAAALVLIGFGQIPSHTSLSTTAASFPYLLKHQPRRPSFVSIEIENRLAPSNQRPCINPASVAYSPRPEETRASSEHRDPSIARPRHFLLLSLGTLELHLAAVAIATPRTSDAV